MDLERVASVVELVEAENAAAVVTFAAWRSHHAAAAVAVFSLFGTRAKLHISANWWCIKVKNSFQSKDERHKDIHTAKRESLEPLRIAR